MLGSKEKPFPIEVVSICGKRDHYVPPIHHQFSGRDLAEIIPPSICGSGDLFLDLCDPFLEDEIIPSLSNHASIKKHIFRLLFLSPALQR
jgi:hypothetical protein